MIPFLYSIVQIVNFAITDGSTAFDYVYYHDAAGWLKLHLTPTPWREARSTCVEEGGVLASPKCQKMTAAMSTVILTSSRPPPYVYTGIHDTYYKGLFYSVEGTPLSQMWASWAEEPYHVDGESCLTMSRTGLLFDNPCSQPFPFICYKREAVTGGNECGTEDRAYRFESRTDSCYKFHVLAESWAEAFATCSREGAHLVVLNSDVEAQVVKEMFNRTGITDVAHAGFTDCGNKTAMWITIHGQTLPAAGYSRWAAGEPQQADSRCGAVFEDGLLDDYFCAQQRPFICEMKRREEKRPPCPHRE